MPILYKSNKYKIFTLWLYLATFGKVFAGCLPVSVALTPPLVSELHIMKSLEVQAWLKDKRFFVGEVRGQNRYGEGVVTYYYEGKPIAERLLREGFGLLIEGKADVECLEPLRAAQIDAMNSKRGIWENPYAASDKALSNKVGQYVLVYDTVYSMRATKGGYYLNFHANYRDNLSGFIANKAKIDVTHLTAKTIYVHGIVSQQSGLSILVERAEQIITP